MEIRSLSGKFLRQFGLFMFVSLSRINMDYGLMYQEVRCLPPLCLNIFLLPRIAKDHFFSPMASPKTSICISVYTVKYREREREPKVRTWIMSTKIRVTVWLPRQDKHNFNEILYCSVLQFACCHLMKRLNVLTLNGSVNTTHQHTIIRDTCNHHSKRDGYR